MQNSNNVATVDKSRHSKVRIKPNPDFVHAKDFNLVGVTLGELSACTSNYPVMFIQNPDNKQFRLVAMLGLRPGENMYYGKDGWDCTYVPLSIQRHPFVIGFDDRVDDNRQLATCLDGNSAFINEKEGLPLFNEAGEETDFMQSRHRMIAQIFEGEKFTERFTNKLTELDLLAPFELIMRPQGGEVRKVTGMHTVSERKLKELQPEQLQELHKLDFLPACYIILGSVFQLHQLMKLRNRKGDEQVADYRIELQPAAAAANADNSGTA